MQDFFALKNGAGPDVGRMLHAPGLGRETGPPLSTLTPENLQRLLGTEVQFYAHKHA